MLGVQKATEHLLIALVPIMPWLPHAPMILNLCLQTLLIYTLDVSVVETTETMLFNLEDLDYVILDSP